jgi:hypothetical protein
MRLPVFANIVATPNATLPVAGVVHNTNTSLGRNGFVGVKTGSDKAAGGCFAFRAIRVVREHRTTITGIVLGQPGDDLIAAGLAAAEAMVDGIAGDRAAPGVPEPMLSPGALPRKHVRRRAGVDALSTRGGNPWGEHSGRWLHLAWSSWLPWSAPAAVAPKAAAAPPQPRQRPRPAPAIPRLLMMSW